MQEVWGKIGPPNFTPKFAPHFVRTECFSMIIDMSGPPKVELGMEIPSMSHGGAEPFWTPRSFRHASPAVSLVPRSFAGVGADGVVVNRMAIVKHYGFRRHSVFSTEGSFGKEKAHKHKPIFPVTARVGGGVGLPTGWPGVSRPVARVKSLCAVCGTQGI